MSVFAVFTECWFDPYKSLPVVQFLARCSWKYSSKQNHLKHLNPSICFLWPSGTNYFTPFIHPYLPRLTSLCAPSSLCSLLWPSPRISPKLWVQGSCPTPWLLLQQWPLQRPRIHWLSVQRLLHRTHTITYCKARLSATPSWDLPPGPSAPHTGQSSSPRTDTPPSDFVQSGTATPKAHCEDTNIINKQQLIGDKYPII